MRIALAQTNCWLADFQRNSEMILQTVDRALKAHCELIVFPELTLMGYPPFDLLERKSVVEEQLKILNELQKKLPPQIGVLLGAITENKGLGKPYFNSAVFIHDHKIQKIFNKELLPVYDVFDDSRHIAEGHIQDNHFRFKNLNLQILICEDMWGWDPLHDHNPLVDLKAQSCDLIINLSASPFTLAKRKERLNMAQKTASHLKAPLIYVNMVGAQDELIYDGGSFVIDHHGKPVAQAEYYKEDFIIFDHAPMTSEIKPVPATDTEHLYSALVLGIRDFILKTGFSKAHLGLSGGIDSGVVACLIADALGPQNLTAIALPTRFNSELSLQLAQKLAQNLQCRFYNLPIEDTFNQAVSSYEKTFGQKTFSLLHENLQSRLRGLFLMAYSNDQNSLLLTTGNKSEYASGYSTLYGDLCGGLAPIGDLLKGQVYDLARWINRNGEIIPQEMIDRPPTAELRENQKDSDSLPQYDLLDKAVEKLVGQKQKAENSTEEWLLKKLYLSEFKRWQAPPILKISNHAFGRGRRMPIAHRAQL